MKITLHNPRASYKSFSQRKNRAWGLDQSNERRKLRTFWGEQLFLSIIKTKIHKKNIGNFFTNEFVSKCYVKNWCSPMTFWDFLF